MVSKLNCISQNSQLNRWQKIRNFCEFVIFSNSRSRVKWVVRAVSVGYLLEMEQIKDMLAESGISFSTASLMLLESVSRSNNEMMAS